MCQRLPLLLLSAAFCTICSLPTTAAAAETGSPKSAGETAAMGALALAKHHYQGKKYKEAAKLFHQAYKLHPLPGFLFNAARSEQRAFQLQAAEDHYREVLQLKDVDAQTRKRAKFHLGEVGEMRKRLKEERQRAEAAALAKRRAESASKRAENARKDAEKAKRAARAKSAAAWKTPVGYGATGLGAVLLGLGAYVALQASADNDALNADLEKTNSAGKIVGTSKEEYTQRRTDIESQSLTSSLLMGAGVAAVGAGVWMLLTKPGVEQSARWQPLLSPATRQVGVLVRF